MTSRKPVKRLTARNGNKNKYSFRSKILEAKIRQIVRLFAVDLDASQIAVVSRLNRNTINRYLAAIRERGARYCEAESPVSGEVEVDESYFGPRRFKGIRRRGARGKTIVFGLFKRNGRVYTQIVTDSRRRHFRQSFGAVQSLRALFILMAGVGPMAWQTWDTKTFPSGIRQQRICQQTNGIESFWAFAKTRLVRFRGLHTHTFYFHLKECEFRFNHRQEEIYKLILKMLRDHPLCSS